MKRSLGVDGLARDQRFTRVSMEERLTERDPDRRQRALEFQRVVDNLFSYGGLRGEGDTSPAKPARRFRELAGFDTAEVDEIAALSREAAQERKERAIQRAQVGA